MKCIEFMIFFYRNLLYPYTVVKLLYIGSLSDSFITLCAICSTGHYYLLSYKTYYGPKVKYVHHMHKVCEPKSHDVKIQDRLSWS